VSPKNYQVPASELPTSANKHEMPPETIEIPPEARIREIHSEPQLTYVEEAHEMPISPIKRKSVPTGLSSSSSVPTVGDQGESGVGSVAPGAALRTRRNYVC
jgi:hypothetical protein